MARGAVSAAGCGPRREAPHRPRHRPDRAAGLHRLPDVGPPRPPPAPDAAALRRPSAGARRGPGRPRGAPRRQVLVAALADALPEATFHGIAAGLHLTVELPPGDDEAAIREE